MNQDVKAKWVAALRSGKYKQARGRLRQDVGFCCLGVLCDILHPEAWSESDGAYTTFGGAAAILPSLIRDEVGLTGDSVVINGLPRPLADHNDDGRTFEQIAIAIETQL